ncbi:MAG: shikimate kinase [Nitrospira sp.]|nr:shikimate kinase [Nitrospira sp.]
MNIVLIGYRGTGKSSAGKILAERLGRRLISTDAEVVRRSGLPIPEIVRQSGWERFRDLESDVCRDLAGQDGLIIDTGGGAILRPQNVTALKTHGTLFWLTAEVATIVGRIGGDNQRPSLTGIKSFTEEVEEVLRERKPIYEAAADHVIDTDGRSLTDIADAILSRL